MITYTDAAGRVHTVDLVGGYSKKVDTTVLDLGPVTGTTTLFGRQVATRSAPPTTVDFKGEAVILITQELVKIVPGHTYDMVSLWRVDGDILHMNGSPRDTFYDRFVAAADGDIIRYRNKPMRKLPASEWAAYDNRTYTMGGMDL